MWRFWIWTLNYSTCDITHFALQYHVPYTYYQGVPGWCTCVPVQPNSVLFGNRNRTPPIAMFDAVSMSSPTPSQKLAIPYFLYHPHHPTKCSTWNCDPGQYQAQPLKWAFQAQNRTTHLAFCSEKMTSTRPLIIPLRYHPWQTKKRRTRKIGPKH